MKTSHRQRTDRRIAFFIFATTLLCYTYFFPRWADNNANSRLDMIVAIVDDGTFKIDKYVGNTVDYAKVDGHYYSDKAPGLAFLGVPIYAVFGRLLDLPFMTSLTDRLANSSAFKSTLREDGSGVNATKVRFALTQVVLSLMLGALPTALLCVLMQQMLLRFGATVGVAAAVPLLYGLCTPAFAYANTMYGHQLSAFLLFAAFYLILDSPRSSDSARRTLSAPAALGVGLLLGYSVITEYPAALIAAVLYVYTAYHAWRAGAPGRMVLVTLGAAICATGLMLYNNAVFGGPLKLGYGSSELWQKQHETGFMSLTLPRLETAWGITFGAFRGLFVLSPIMALAVPGLWLWWRTREQRAEWWVASLATLTMFLFNASSIMWWGGWSVGPRYLLPALPFFALALAYAFRSAWLRRLGIVLALAALGATWFMTLAEQSFPSDGIANPWADHALPNWQSGNIARNIGTILGMRGLAGLAPLLALVVALLAMLQLNVSRARVSARS
jgi:hypothetical protein